jgi:aminopeptidase-like protein/aminoglycoside N3'-acetyltransferase
MREGSTPHYSRSDVIAALRTSGLGAADTVFVSTGLGTLGIPPPQVTSQVGLNQLFLDCLREVLGPRGNLLVPTYSYTFGKGSRSEPAVYDPTRTPAEIGPFPEYFRQQPGVLRTIDPMMSVSGEGPDCAALFADLPPTSFGEDCIFARLAQHPVKCCNIGLGPNWTPFIHHADWLARVPFRYDKRFTGIHSIDGVAHRRAWLFSVRLLSDNSFANAHRLGQLATDAGIWTYAPLGRARVYTCDYAEYFRFALRLLRVDPWLTAKGPPGDPVVLEEQRVPPRRQVVDLGSDLLSRECLMRLQAQRRDTVSDSMDASFIALAKLVPLRLHRVPSGTNCRDWIVPEKWSYRHARLTALDGEPRTLLDADFEPGCILSYSLSFAGEVRRERLFAHLSTDRASADAAPIAGSFNDRDWGFCVSEERKAQWRAERYQVDIAADFSYGHLKVAEAILPGRTADSVLLCAYLQGPFRVNECLSGVVVALRAWQILSREPRAERTLRVLILPGPVGLATWLDKVAGSDLPIHAGLTLRMLGRAYPHCLQLPVTADRGLSASLLAVLKRHDALAVVDSLNGSAVELPSGGNPVAPQPQPGLGFSMLDLSRALVPDAAGSPFPGYGTDQDTADRISMTGLKRSLELVLALLRELLDSEPPAA